MEKFELGQMAVTWNVRNLMAIEADFKTFVFACLERYRRRDWGDLAAEDKAMNDEAVQNGEDRILAAYNHPQYPDWKIRIITEWDHSATTILFPNEH